MWEHDLAARSLGIESLPFMARDFDSSAIFMRPYTVCRSTTILSLVRTCKDIIQIQIDFVKLPAKDVIESKYSY